MDDTLTDWQIMKITEIEIRTMPRFASLLCLEVELVFKELNHFGAIALFFRDWTPGTLTGGVFANLRIYTKVYASPVSVPGAQSRKNNAIAPKWFYSLDTNSTLRSFQLGRCHSHCYYEIFQWL